MDNEDVESLYSSEAEELYENNVQDVEVTHDDEDVCKNVPSLDKSPTDSNAHGFIGGSSSNVNTLIQRPVGLPYDSYECHGAYNFGGQHCIHWIPRDVFELLLHSRVISIRNRKAEGEEEKMQQRKSTGGSGRPSGTDGYDFSYRMVVDSRYTKVAKGKSRLSKLIVSQAIIQLVGVLTVLQSISKDHSFDILVISPTIIGYISLMIGELGRRHSRVNFLKFYMFASSIAILLSIGCIFRSNFLIEVIQDPSTWETKKFELLKTVGAILGLLVQIFSITTTISLTHNMSPPKRTS